MQNKKKCYFCNKRKIIKFLDLGQVALAGSFLKKKLKKYEKKYPLQVGFCVNCFAVQVLKKINPSILFKNYFYFSSSIKTLIKHFTEFGFHIIKKFDLKKEIKVIEIGCNDGVLLNAFYKIGFKNLFGIDPAKNVIKKIRNKNIKVFNNFFSYKESKKIEKRYGKFDLIIANNVFAHINNIRDAVRGVSLLLNKNGIFVFEVHYLGKILKEKQFDMIYHEHVYYYSMLSAKNLINNLNLKVFDYEFTNIHSGSIRFYVSKNNSKFNVSLKVKKLIKKEKKEGLNNLKTFINFQIIVEKYLSRLKRLVKNLNEKGNLVFGYGASGRANTILQACNFTTKEIPYIIDDAPKKHNHLTPGSHIPIKSPKILNKFKPEYILLFAWSFFYEIKNKNKDKKNLKYIIPFPNPKIKR